MRLLLILTILVALSSDGKPELRIYPNVLLRGGAVHVMCRVPRHPDNRWLDWGFTFGATRGRQLDGENAAITYEYTFDHIGCDDGQIFCQVTRVTDGKVKYLRAVHPLGVAGCEP